MKYSADDILQQTFEKKLVGGFAQDQVREFLSVLAHEWETMTDELLRLQDDIEIQAKELGELRKRERSLLDALSTARDVADQMVAKAEERGERVIEEARAQAEQMITSAQREQTRLIESTQELQRQRAGLVLELRDVLRSHERLLDTRQSTEFDIDIEQHVTQPVIELEPAETVEAKDDGPTIHRRPRQKVVVEDEDFELEIVEHRDEDDEIPETLIGTMTKAHS